MAWRCSVARYPLAANVSGVKIGGLCVVLTGLLCGTLHASCGSMQG